ncbi:MAG: CPBP family intramembrane metalloprotease [Bacteroidia bacterium]|nr:CPBP family intramembrane metalloprotease [Bacteroidia bacterium]
MLKENNLRTDKLYLQLLLASGVLICCLVLMQQIAVQVIGPLFGISSENTAMMLANFTFQNSQEILAFKCILASIQAGAFGLATLILVLIYPDRKKTLGISTPISAVTAFLVILTLLISLPFIQFTTFNPETFHLPERFKEWEQALKDAESKTELMLRTILKQDLALNILVVALFPAVMEELFFRGYIQQLFRQYYSARVSIICAGFIFSIAHFQVYGLIPRALLGIGLGFLLEWSGSLWLSILAHFTNNAISVLIAWFVLQGNISEKFMDNSFQPHWTLVLLSAILVLLGLNFIKRIIQKNN